MNLFIELAFGVQLRIIQKIINATSERKIVIKTKPNLKGKFGQYEKGVFPEQFGSVNILVLLHLNLEPQGNSY